MRPNYTPGDPIRLRHILDAWLQENPDLPAALDLIETLAPGIEVWFLTGAGYFQAEIDDDCVVGWQPKFELSAADPEFFTKLKTIIVNSERSGE